ncbi:hypothetical protein JCM8097_008600 [Rhodosporidiobolus ruineniae]
MRQHRLPLDALPTLCLVKVVALSPSLTQPSSPPPPHLNHLLACALDASAGLDFPLSLDAWIAELLGEDPTEALREIADDIQDQVSLSTFPLLRASPLGVCLRRLYLSLGKMSFEEAVGWWADVEGWCEGRKARSGQMGVEERFAQARLRQDYQAARDLVRSFGTGSTGGDSSTSVTPQQALLHLALVEYEDGGYEAAEQALDEATRIARTMGDVAILADCSSLRSRLSAASPLSRPSSSHPDSSSSSNLAPNPNAPYDLLHAVSSSLSSPPSSSSSASADLPPLPALWPTLYSASALASHLALPHVPPSSSSNTAAHGKKEEQVRPLPPVGLEGEVGGAGWKAGWEAVVGEIWGEMGIAPLASLHSSLALSYLDQAALESRSSGRAGGAGRRADWDLRLSILRSQALRLTRANNPSAALALLLDAVSTRQKRAGMGVREVGRWRAVVEEVEALSKQRREGGSGNELDPFLPLPTALSASLTAFQTTSLTLHLPTHLHALLSLLSLRLSLAAASPGRGVEEAQRALEELDEGGEIWGAVMGLAEAEAGVGGTGEGEELRARAREVKARCLVVASQADDAQLPAAIELLEDALAGYSSLSLLPSRLRVLSTLTHLAAHLASAPPSKVPASAAAHWRTQRDEWAAAYLRLKEEGGGEEEGERERWERVWRVVGEVECAVEAEIGVAR